MLQIIKTMMSCVDTARERTSTPGTFLFDKLNKMCVWALWELNSCQCQRFLSTFCFTFERNMEAASLVLFILCVILIFPL